MIAVELRNPMLWPAYTGQIWSILGPDMTVPYMLILEALLWVRPTLENLCGLWVGSNGIFLLTLKSFEMHPVESAKPLRWRTFIWRLKSG